MTINLAASTGYADFQYHIQQGGFAIGHRRYQINLVATPCGFGGVRWRWICPQTGTRICNLYLPSGGTRFMSRGLGGHNLGYASQRESEIQRLHRRADRLRCRLQSEHRRDLPPKPARMRWKTYERLTHQLRTTELKIEEMF